MQDSCLGKCFTNLKTHGLSNIYIYLFIKSGRCFSLRNLIKIDSSLICTMSNIGKCNFAYINVCTHYRFIHCIFCSDFCFIWFLYTFEYYKSLTYVNYICICTIELISCLLDVMVKLFYNKM